MVHLADDDKAHFERLFRAHYHDVAAFVRRRSPADMADDVTAEAFLVAWRRLDEIPPDSLPWLLGVARHVLLNARRSKRRQQALTQRVAATTTRVGSSMPEFEDRDTLAALARLPLAEREVLTLIVWEGVTISQAAAVLGCSAVTARVRLYRARRRLKQWLDEGSGNTMPTASHEIDVRKEAS